jgi:hypothetical protein
VAGAAGIASEVSSRYSFELAEPLE